MNAHISKDPLHGVTLEMQVNALVDRFGWAELSQRININCFKNEPSVKSSLKFLRRTPWARAEVEALYLDSLHDVAPIKSTVPAIDPWANSRLKKK
ncbi:VF530 family protein [Citrobacter sp. Marseille-Q6884]|uniref:VF530 family protein n=1 Tax=Citrobacter sp. Marseille-Q6884 TaxID=2956786 RepID=UPI0021B46504|nr:VF530 family protein [Citrobacter sp. Marseille-Q6884]